MSDLAALCGSVIVAGLPDAVAAPSTLDALHRLGPAGVILFERNVSTPDETRDLVAAARAAIGGRAPALVCVDQEGGRVARLRFRETEIPAMLGLGTTGDEALAERVGAALADDLRRVGANVDLAPVLDLALDARSTIVGTRSLGDDPQRVGRLGAALVRGVQSRGVAATAKHFPGHGATALDSHRDVPTIDASERVLRARDLVPFAAAIAAGVRLVMTAHAIVGALDARHPATLSRAILTDLLRGELGFAGVCITDCLEMDGIAAKLGTVRAGVLALAAGADALLVSHDLALAVALREALEAAVTSGEIPLARLEAAAARVEALRVACAPGDAGCANSNVGDDVARELARRAILVVRGRPELDATRPVTIVSFEGDASDGVARSTAQRPSLNLALRRRRVRSEIMRVSRDPDADTTAMLCDVVRAQGDRALVIVARRAHLHPGQQAAIDALLALAPQAIAISALEPYDVALLSNAKTVACTFGDEAANVEALADLLAGTATAARDAVAPGA